MSEKFRNVERSQNAVILPNKSYEKLKKVIGSKICWSVWPKIKYSKNKNS